MHVDVCHRMRTTHLSFLTVKDSSAVASELCCPFAHAFVCSKLIYLWYPFWGAWNGSILHRSAMLGLDISRVEWIHPSNMQMKGVTFSWLWLSFGNQCDYCLKSIQKRPRLWPGCPFRRYDNKEKITKQEVDDTGRDHSRGSSRKQESASPAQVGLGSRSECWTSSSSHLSMSSWHPPHCGLLHRTWTRLLTWGYSSLPIWGSPCLYPPCTAQCGLLSPPRDHKQYMNSVSLDCNRDTVNHLTVSNLPRLAKELLNSWKAFQVGKISCFWLFSIQFAMNWNATVPSDVLHTSNVCMR